MVLGRISKEVSTLEQTWTEKLTTSDNGRQMVFTP